MITTGLGPVYDGVAHFALTPEDSIPVAGLAVLAGLRGPAHGRLALFACHDFLVCRRGRRTVDRATRRGFYRGLVAPAGRRPRRGGRAAVFMGGRRGRRGSRRDARLCRWILAAERLQRFSHGFGNERSGICELRDRRGVFVAPAVAVGPHRHARLRELDRRERSSAVGLDVARRDSNCGSVNDRSFRKANHQGEKTMNRLANGVSTLAIPALALSMLLSAMGNGAAVEADIRQITGPAEKTPENYSPFINQNFPDRVLWGATHIHTGLSADAGLTGVTLLPADMFRYARGEVVTIDSGLKVRLDRPLDWFAVTDHAEYLGLADQLRRGDPALLADPTGKKWYDMYKQGPQMALKAAWEAIDSIFLNKPEINNPQLAAGAWAEATEAVEKFNDPGRFHHAARLRMDIGARGQQSSSHRHFPRRRGPREADHSVFLLRQPGSGGPLEVHGPIREADRRPGPRHPPQRQFEQWPHVHGRDLLTRSRWTRPTPKRASVTSRSWR